MCHIHNAKSCAPLGKGSVMINRVVFKSVSPPSSKFPMCCSCVGHSCLGKQASHMISDDASQNLTMQSHKHYMPKPCRSTPACVYGATTVAWLSCENASCLCIYIRLAPIGVRVWKPWPSETNTVKSEPEARCHMKQSHAKHNKTTESHTDEQRHGHCIRKPCLPGEMQGACVLECEWTEMGCWVLDVYIFLV